MIKLLLHMQAMIWHPLKSLDLLELDGKRGKNKMHPELPGISIYLWTQRGRLSTLTYQPSRECTENDAQSYYGLSGIYALFSSQSSALSVPLLSILSICN